MQRQTISGFDSLRIRDDQPRRTITDFIGMEDALQIVGHSTGTDISDHDENHVHTIDMWFSRRRGVWLVERLNTDGHVIGAIHRCETEDDAQACVQEWLRAHAETRLIAPGDRAAVRQRVSKPATRERRRAA